MNRLSILTPRHPVTCIVIYCIQWILPERIHCFPRVAHPRPLQDKHSDTFALFTDSILPQSRRKDFFSTMHWHVKTTTVFNVNYRQTLLWLHSDRMGECWSCHRGSRRRGFAFVAQRQDVFLQVCDPSPLNRQWSMKHFLTEPEQEGKYDLNWVT